MSNTKPVSLDGIINEAVGAITIDGIEYGVLGLNAIEYELVKAIEAGEIEDDKAIWACVERIVPSMPADVRKTKLTMPAIGAILGVAQGMIARVGDALPNSSGPTTTKSPASTSPSESRGD